MNSFYRVVFCKSTGVFKAVSELAKSGKKTKSISIAAGVLASSVVMSSAAIAAVGDPIASGDALGLNALAVGETNTVDGNRSTAIGSDNGVSGESNTALGVNNKIRPTEDYLYNGDGDGMEILLTPSIRSTAIGVENTIEGNESVANGVFNKAKANNVTITGGRNEVSSKESGTYGQGNYVGKDMVVPALARVARVRVDDGYRIGYRGYIDEGSYAYGNSNRVIGDKSHAVGNSNNVSGDKNGLLGNGNNLSTERYEQPRMMATARMAVSDGELSRARMPVGDGELSRARMPVSDGEPSRIRWDGRDEGSFLVGNENEVNGVNTHAVGNQNQIRNDDNVTLGSGNRVEFYQDEYMGEATLMRVPVEATRIRDDSERRIIRRNTSTAIVGANNTLEAAGVHIVGTDNNIQQAYSYVVGGSNTIKLPFNPPMSGMMGNPPMSSMMGNSPMSGMVGNPPMSGMMGSESGSNVFGSGNYTESEKSLVVGDNNQLDQKSLLAVVTGNVNNISGVSSSTVGNSNQIQKDVGGAHGTMNRVRGNTGALQAINAAYDAYNSGEAESFEGLDLDDDGVVDFATVEDFMLMVNQSGSYAYGNINNIQGEGIHTVGNNNEFSGDSNKGLGNSNRIGQVGGMVGNSDAVLPTVNFDGSATYGDFNVVNADSAQTIGNENVLGKEFSSVTGYNNSVVQGLSGELVDVTTEQRRIAGTFVSGNDNSVESHGGHVSGSGNKFQADNATLSGNGNIVIGDGGHVVGDDNEVYGNGNNGFGNDNVIGKAMDGDYSTVDSSHIVGNNNTVKGNLSSAFGNKNTVSGDETSVIGLSNTVDGEGSLALGNYNNSESSMVTIVGGYNTIDNDHSDNAVAVGQNNNLTGNQAVAMGNNNSIEKDASGAIGVKNYIADGFDRNGLAGEGLAGMGDDIDYDKYIERGSYAQGNKNDVRGDTTHVYGYQNSVLGNKTSVVGANNSVSGNGAQVIGNDNTIGYNNDGMPQYGDNIAVLGSKNTVEAENSFVVGSNNTVDRGADGSLVFGSNASSSVAGGVAIGNNSVADRENAVSVGSAGAERQITNVADATETKDAVNLGQLNASLRDTTGGKNLTATRTDTGYEVALNDAITLDSVTTGSSTLDTNGLKVGDVTVSSVGLDNAGNRVTSVGDATLRSDAVNYGQFTDGLAGTIKSVTGDENIIATTDAEKNVSLVLNKDLVADSLTAGDTVINNAGFTNGATTLGNTGLKVGDVTVSSAGLDNAGNRVTNVGDAIENSDAVNYGQFKAGLTDTTAGKNIAVKRTDTGYEVSTVDDMTLTSMTAGDTLINNAGFTNGATTLGNTGLKVGDVTVSSVGLDNAGNRVTSVGDATLRSDAVNYGQFTDGLAGTIKSVTGDENITATTDAEKNVSLVLKKDITVDSMTAGNTVINDAGFTNGATTLGNTGLKVGDVTVSSAGLDNAGNRVTSVGNAIEDTDAVNYGQFKAGITDTTAGKNIAVKRTDTGYEVSTVEDMTLTSVKTGDTLINNAGFTNGATTVGGGGLKVGDVTVSNVGLDNAGNRVTSVGDATLRSDAVNYGQFTDGLAGTIKSVTGDENITATTDAEKNVSLVLNRDLDVDSVTAGSNVFDSSGLQIGDVTIGNEVGIYAGDMRVRGVADAVESSDAVNLGQVSIIDDRLTNENIAQNTIITNNTNAINKGFNVGNGVTSNKFELGDTVDITAGKNSKVTTTDTGVEVSVADDLVVTTVTTGNTLVNTDGVRAGDVFLSATTGLDNAGNRVTSVGDGEVRSDAVNYGQFTDGLAGTIKSVTGDENITATTDANKNVSLVLNKDIAIDSMTAGDTLINNAGFTNGATTVGGAGLKVGDVTVSNVGLDNAGNRVTSVGDAVNRTDAVNYGQYLDGIKDLTAPDNYFHTNATGSAQTGNATNLDSINGIGGAKGAGSIAIGMNAQATGTNAVAIGNNLAEGNNALVSGGSNNEALGAFSSVASGRDNVALSDYAVVLGGVGNVAGSLETDEFETRYGQYSVIAGGLNNTTAGSKSVISGGEGNTANGNFSSIGGGGNNVANDQFGTIAGGQNNTTTGTHNFIGGGQNNNANSFNSSIVGGIGNSINDASRGFIGGGQNNEIHRSASVIGGGQDNSSFATHSTIGGGFNNIVEETGAFSVIAGGYDNRTRGQDAVVSGGRANAANGAQSVVAGGRNNIANAQHSTVSGGTLNKANAIRSTVAGGFENTAGGEYSAIAGGRNNIANGNYSFIGGGWENQTGGNFDTVGGGTLNKATGSRSTVSGGYGNQASNEFSAVGGGRDNVASGTNSTVSGGRFNRATATNSSVIGGLNNVASGASSVVGGESNVASGVGSVVLGSNNNAGSLNAVAIGGQNTVNGTNSAAIGSNNTVVNNDVFVLGSNTTSTQDNSVLLGNNTTDKAATAVSDTTIGDITFENFAGVSAVENGVISVGSVGAERQIVNVGAGELSATSTDAVNGSQLYSVAGTIDRLAASTVSNLGGNATLGADGTISHTNIGGTGQDTLDGAIQAANNSIKSVTGDANITATTDDDKNVIVALNKDLNVDSVTTGNTSFNTDGVRAGDVFLSSTNGLYNAGNKVTGVGDATERDDAVNYGQFQDGLNGLTKTTVDGDANITATKNATGYDVTLNQDVTLSSVTTGVTSIDNSGLKVGDVTVSTSGLDNAGNRVTSVGDAIVRDDAVNYGQFQDGMANTIKSVTGDENIIATTDAEKNVILNLKKDIAVDSMTAGDTIINNAGFTNGATTVGNTGLKVGDVTVSSTGLDNAGNRVTSVGDAIVRSDAVNYGQFTDGMANTIKSVTGDENIIATTDAERNVILNLKKDIVVDSMTAGDTLINNNGMTIGDSFFGATGVRTGDVILSSTSGLYNGGYRVTGVDRAVEGTDAVNFDQFNEALNNIAPTNIKGDANITVTNTGSGFDIGLNKDLTADSVTTGGTTVSNAGLTTGDVTVSNSGLSNGGNRVTNIGDAVEGSDAVSFDQFNKKFDDMIPTDIKGDSNITVTKTDTGFDLNLNKDLTADSVTVGNTSITNDGLKVGDVSITAGGLNNGGNTVKGVGDGVLRDDAVNKGQLDDLEVRQNIKNEAQDIIINNKLDRDEFLKDQERQDALLEGKADKAELDKTNVNVSNNTTNISKNSDILKDHEKELGRLEDVKADKAELDKTNIKVQDNADKNKEQDKVLGEHKTELDRLEDVKADKSDLEAKADKTYVDKEITATNDRFSEINKENNAKFDKFEKSQTTIDSSQNVRIDRNEQAIADLGYKVDNLEGKLSAGIASSVAMASMPSSFIKGEARIAGGFGYYNGQNAIAIGITGATETGDYSYKLGSSYTQEGGAVVGAGISYRLW